MKQIFFFLLLLLMMVTGVTSCKKGTEDPVVVPRPDTLSAGWSKTKVSGTFLLDIVFANASIGYTASRNACYKTTDGGLNWSSLPGYASVAGIYDNMAITPDGKLFLVTGNRITRSIDGGVSFSVTAPVPLTMSDIWVLDNNNAYGIYSSGILRTTDGGQNWNPVSPITGISDTGGTYPIGYFINATTGWICNENSTFKTNGNINTWTRANYSPALTTGIDNITSVYATSSSIVYTGCSSGKIYKSIDGGSNFILLKDFTNGNNLSDLHFIDANTGYFSYSNRIYKTIDAGINWQVVVALGESFVTEIHFTDATHGWACTSNGEVLRFN